MQTTEYMTKWTDAKGREWRAHLNLGLCLKLRDDLAVDFLGDPSATALPSLLIDQEKLGLSLWAVCQSQCEARGVTRDSFFESLDGEALARGWAALHDGFLLFCPASNRAETARLIEWHATVLQQAAEAIQKRLDNEATQTVASEAIAAGVAETCGTSS